MLGIGYFRNPHIFSRCPNLCAKYWLYKYSLYYFCCSCFLSFVSFFELKLFKENYSNCIMSLDWLKKIPLDTSSELASFFSLVTHPKVNKVHLVHVPGLSPLVRVSRFVPSAFHWHPTTGCPSFLPPASRALGGLLYDLTATKLVPLALCSIIYPFSTQEKEAEKANSWGRHESHRETISLLLPHQKKGRKTEKKEREKGEGSEVGGMEEGRDFLRHRRPLLWSIPWQFDISLQWTFYIFIPLLFYCHYITYIDAEHTEWDKWSTKQVCVQGENKQ